MAKCSRCGKSVGLFASMCDGCKAELKAEEIAQRRRLENEKHETAQKAHEEYEAHKTNMVVSRTQSIRHRIENGEKVFLYESAYLPVDSSIVERAVATEFSIGVLRQMGFNGWDIVAVIPRTIGIALTNESYGSSTGETWGAGLGGNVVGVHVILRKEISIRDDIPDDALSEYISRNLNDFLSEEESATLIGLLRQSEN